jgi:hypothetical protein
MKRLNTEELEARLSAHMKAAEMFHKTLCYRSWHWHTSESRRMLGLKPLDCPPPDANGQHP